MAAWSWYGPTGVPASAPVTRAVPSAISPRSQRARSCSASGTRLPSGRVRAGRRASVSSMSASSPVTSPSPGSHACNCRVSRIASSVSSTRCSAGPELAVYPSLKIRYSTCSTAASREGSSCGGGTGTGRPLSRMRCFARLIRCAIVASGTRNALGDLAGGQPADRAQRQRDRRRLAECRMAAQQQQREGVVPVDRVPEAAAPAARAVRSRRCRAESARYSSIRRRAATVISQPSGLAGSPSTGHCRTAVSSASCTASSHVSKSPYRRIRAVSTRGASSRSVPSPGVPSPGAPPGVTSSARPGCGPAPGAPPRPRGRPPVPWRPTRPPRPGRPPRSDRSRPAAP